MKKEQTSSATEGSSSNSSTPHSISSFSPCSKKEEGRKTSLPNENAPMTSAATAPSVAELPHMILPSMASKEYLENLPASLGEVNGRSLTSTTEVPPSSSIAAGGKGGEDTGAALLSPATSKTSSLASLFSRVLQLQFGQDPELPTIGARLERRYNGWLDYWTSPVSPLRPKDYVDAYTRPNPCPEEYWWASWRWPRTKYVNAKVPPPENGEYRDYYHYLAFKMWLERERDVYVAQANLVQEMLNRCIVKEGQYNAAKNCRHLYNKAFAMSRMEELNQALLYMAMTGNNAIRETPYPENFVDVKRKVYDDWLYRTRLRKPGDVV